MIDMTVADAVPRHLGGRAFLAAAGAKQIMQTASSVTYKLPGGRARNGANRVRFILGRGGHITMEFFRLSATEYRPCGAVYGLVGAQLRAAFEQETGIKMNRFGGD